MRILVTGFEPFGGSSVNPSGEIAKLMNGREVGGVATVGRVLPVRWYVAIQTVLDHIAGCRPDAVIMFGQAGRRAAMAIERIGINVCEGKDNSGEEGAGRPIAAGGPDGIFSRLPVRDVVAAMRAAGVPAEISNSAGTYLCNHIAYGAPQALLASGSTLPAGFIHTPMLPEQLVHLEESAGARGAMGRSCLPLDWMVRAAEAAVL
ncbi:MAG TPA: pyroglutamyl-peptidase I, partial [Bacillota bacterium]|nr:pyroglutamyl-peptidase I [Bacillota bacterium]